MTVTARQTTADERAAGIVERLSLDEKIQLVTGRVGWPVDENGELLHPQRDPQPAHVIPPPGAIGSDGFVPGIARLGIPALQLCGAGVGVTNLQQQRADGAATVYPSAIAQTASWDPAVTGAFGAALAREAACQGINVLLAGACNLAADPRCGRLFEYHGEDPVLAGIMVAAELKAGQDEGVVTSIKHFAANYQETGRFMVNSVIDERSLRQGELLVFELAIARSGVGAVMSSYNLLNGTYTSENRYLLTEVLKDEWGFPGWVMSDWGATHSTVPAALAGLDQEFPMNEFFGDALKAAVERGEAPAERLDDMCHRILRTMVAVGLMDNPPRLGPVDHEAGQTLARELVRRTTVLLTNNGILPLSAQDAPHIAVIGGHADLGVPTGGGSASMEPYGGDPLAPDRDWNARDMFRDPVWVAAPPLAGIRRHNPNGTVRFVPGDDVAAAVAAARGADVVVLFATQYATEHFDLPDLALPDGQDELIEAVAAANPRVVVVLENGGPVLTPWADRVAAVVEAWYPGHGGDAIADILFGAVNPSAKLPITFPRSEADLPRPEIPRIPVKPGHTEPERFAPHQRWDWADWPFDVHYDEGLALGNKWYDSKGIEPAFCFGHGLSFTTFGYADPVVTVGAEGVRVSFAVTNTGERSGAEVAQVYAALPEGLGEPPRRLVGWARTELRPGESATLEVSIEPKLLAVWDVDRHAWSVPQGTFGFHVGASSRDLRLRTDAEIGDLRV